MRKKTLSLSIMLFIGGHALAQIQLPKIISEGMVLQRNTPTRIWGKASSNENVSLEFSGKTYKTKSDDMGNWEFVLPAKKEGGPYEMNFKASNEVSVKNILFGDVYVCSGQSNMELPMDRLRDKYPDEIAASKNANIRQIIIPDEYDFNKERTDLSSAKWEAAEPGTIGNFSAVAYFFALNINRKLGVPIGIINTALGGSPAQAWMSERSLKDFPNYYHEMQQYKNEELIATIEKKDNEASSMWYSALNKNDKGLKLDWKSANTNTADWKELILPAYFPPTVLDGENGVVWLKKEIIVQDRMAGKSAKLLLGRLVDADSVFVNGIFAGTTTYQYPPRRYILKGNLIKTGKNEITVRLISNSGRAGFVPDKKYQLISSGDTLSLDGVWKYKEGAKMPPTPAQTFVRWKSGGLYNAMIAPLQRYKIKGFIWYQGEANTGRPEEYFGLMKHLIANWRSAWNQGELPFLLVQLPGFMERDQKPVESKWAELRDAQQKVSTLTNTAMAVAIDLGEWNDIHPLNKKDIGFRLSLQAEKLIYNKAKIVASGPVFSSLAAANGRLILSFKETGTGLIAKNGQILNGFAIAGKDKKYVWAKAVIAHNKVVVWNEDIKEPVFIRYAWANNPEGANLYNRENLPAAPFEATLKTL